MTRYSKVLEAYECCCPARPRTKPGQRSTLAAYGGMRA